MGQTITNYQDVAISPAVGFTVAETKEAYEVKPTFTKIDNILLGNENEPGLYAYLGEAELRLMLAISRFTTGYQGRAYWQASQETVAQQTRMGRKAVMRAADSLGAEGKKLITVSKSRGVTMWRINFENIAPFMLKMSPKDSTNESQRLNDFEPPMSPKDSSNESQRLNHGVLKTRPSKKEITKERIKENTTTNASKSDAPFLESEADSEFLAELKRLQATNSTIDGKDDSANYPTLGAVVVPPPSAAQNPPPAIDPRVVAYCNALGWVIDGKGVMAKASANVNGLCAFYGDTLTGDDMAAVLAHLKKLDVKMNPTAIKAKFGEAVQDVEIMTNSRNKALVEAIKVMYGQTNGVEYRLEFEYSKLASRMAQRGIAPEQVLAFPAIWESNCNGYTLPGYGHINLVANIENMKMKGNGNQVTKSAEQTKTEAEAWLAEVTQGVR